MQRTMMRSKIHRAKVTGASVDYVGSISICPDLMAAADLMVGEQVHVVDVDNGARLTTYAIQGDPGEICLNGAAAHLVDVGDLVIIITYGQYDEEELRDYSPIVVHVDTENVQISEELARELAGERKYVTVDA